MSRWPLRSPGLAAALLFIAAPGRTQTGVDPNAAAVAPAIVNAPFPVSVAEVFGHVQFLASPELGGRGSGSPEGAIASTYIAAEFAKLGLAPAGEEGTFWQPFDRIQVTLGEVKADGTATQVQQTLRCRNVLAWLPGSDAAMASEYLLIAAHYDHLGRRGDTIHPGADDNASGVAGLLAIARALVHGTPKPRRSVLFAAFDAEEQGLIGAETFARKPARTLQQLVAMINLDMIGRPRLLDRKSMALGKKLAGIPDGPAVGVLGMAQSPELGSIVKAVFATDAFPVFGPADFGMLGAVIEKQAAGRSDHAPFERRQIPFLFFSTAEHDDYHEPTDTVATVDRQVVWRIAAGVYRTVLAIDANDQRPTFVAKPKVKGEAERPDGGK
jgi:Zn-dependent M28 family amino/carboxypeptidase